MPSNKTWLATIYRSCCRLIANLPKLIESASTSPPTHRNWPIVNLLTISLTRSYNQSLALRDVEPLNKIKSQLKTRLSSRLYQFTGFYLTITVNCLSFDRLTSSESWCITGHMDVTIFHTFLFFQYPYLDNILICFLKFDIISWAIWN